MHGMTVCYIHGGNSPVGLGSATFKHGRYSKFLPLRLAAHYAEAEKDPDLLNLRDEMALCETRLVDLLQRVDTGEAGAIWGQARAAMGDFQKAKALGDTDKMRATLAALEGLIDRGAEEWRIWQEIGDQIEARRKLVVSEHKRLVAMEQMITSERAMLLLAAVVSVIQTHVSDRSALDGISRDLRAILARQVGGAALANGDGTGS